MEVKVNSKDKIAELKSTSIKTNPYYSTQQTYRSSSYDASTSKSSSRVDTKFDDTVHYMSLATTPALTECEGDFLYQHFVSFQDELPRHSPDYGSSSSGTSISCDEPELQRTVAIIKPSAMKYKDVVLRAVKEAGLIILHDRTLHLSPEQISEVYYKHYGDACFPHMVVAMSVAPLMVLSIAGKNCIDKWKTMVGPYGWLREEWFFPYSVRTRFGIQPDTPDMVHASENSAEARKETRYFFPRSVLEPTPAEEEKVTDYLSLYVKPTLMQGLIHVVNFKPIDPVLFLAEWLLLNNPYQPSFPENVSLSPL